MHFIQIRHYSDLLNVYIGTLDSGCSAEWLHFLSNFVHRYVFILILFIYNYVLKSKTFT